MHILCDALNGVSNLPIRGAHRTARAAVPARILHGAPVTYSGRRPDFTLLLLQACIVAWFRAGHTECPCCRDGGVAIGRIDALARAAVLSQRARRRGASNQLKRAAERVRAARVSMQDATRVASAMRRENLGVLRAVRAADRKKWKAQGQWWSARRQLGVSNFADEPVPLLARPQMRTTRRRPPSLL